MANESTIFREETTPEFTSTDVAWVLKNAFLVLTMQSGFGLLEAGCVSTKNVANIMVKNYLDVVFGSWNFVFCCI